MQRILYVRNAPYKVNLSLYNLQEIGFCKALCKQGYDCDIVYYSDVNKDEKIYIDESTGKEIKLLWRKGYKILRTGIYPSLLKKEFINQYDLIITTEYDQIMSLLWTMYKPKVVLYNGPYYNMFKIPIMEKIYDMLFVKLLNKRLHKIFTKSDLSKKYLEKKGFEDIETLGVGLDNEVFESKNDLSEEITELTEYMENNKCLLYIGSLIDRKNFRFSLKVFEKVNKENPEIKMIVIGNGKKQYVEKSFELIDKNIRKNIILIDKIDNKFLKNIYQSAEVFILPSKLEIFGMVLLEAMYFGVPVISSLNGGSSTLIEDGVNGITIDRFSVDIWTKEILNICQDKNYSDNLRVKAVYTINEKFLWENICKKFMESI